MSYTNSAIKKVTNVQTSYSGKTSDQFISSDLTLPLTGEYTIYDGPEGTPVIATGYTYYLPNATGSGREIIFKAINCQDNPTYELLVDFGESTLDGALYTNDGPLQVTSTANGIGTYSILDTGVNTWQLIYSYKTT